MQIRALRQAATCLGRTSGCSVVGRKSDTAIRWVPTGHTTPLSTEHKLWRHLTSGPSLGHFTPVRTAPQVPQCRSYKDAIWTYKQFGGCVSNNKQRVPQWVAERGLMFAAHFAAGLAFGVRARRAPVSVLVAVAFLLDVIRIRSRRLWGWTVRAVCTNSCGKQLSLLELIAVTCPQCLPTNIKDPGNSGCKRLRPILTSRPAGVWTSADLLGINGSSKKHATASFSLAPNLSCVFPTGVIGAISRRDDFLKCNCRSIEIRHFQ